jgi:hypothetical protein
MAEFEKNNRVEFKKLKRSLKNITGRSLKWRSLNFKKYNRVEFKKLKRSLKNIMGGV